MITSITNQPNFYTQCWGPIVYGCISDQIGATNMKYVFDVYFQSPTAANPSLIAEIKLSPNPSGSGILDVQSIVQPYLSASDSVLPEVSFAATGASAFYLPTSMFGKVFCMVGEEFSNNPT